MQYSRWLDSQDDPHALVFRQTQPFRSGSNLLSWTEAMLHIEIGSPDGRPSLHEFAGIFGRGQDSPFVLADRYPVPQFIAYLLAVSRIRAEARITNESRELLTVQARAAGLDLLADTLFTAEGERVCRINDDVRTLDLLSGMADQSSRKPSSELAHQLREANLTASEWQTTDEPAVMLRLLSQQLSPPQSRLLTCRLLGSNSPNVAVAERFSKRQASLEEALAAWRDEENSLCGRYGSDAGVRTIRDGRSVHNPLAPFAGLSAEEDWWEGRSTVQCLPPTDNPLFALSLTTVGSESSHPIYSAHPICDLIREVVGNPFHPVVIDPEWLSSTVVSLAYSIRSESAFDRMPYLADALRDVGCNDTNILSHCWESKAHYNTNHFGGGWETKVHCQDCWLLTALLGSEPLLRGRNNNRARSTSLAGELFRKSGALDRKYRLCLCGSARRFSRQFGPRQFAAIEEAERIADGLADTRPYDLSSTHDWLVHLIDRLTFHIPGDHDYLVTLLRFLGGGEARDLPAHAAEVLAQEAIVRDVFGDPRDTLTFDPQWRTSTVVAMARHLYESGDFTAMPILADALQDAGCEDPKVLRHCRANRLHVKGCWVVDLILQQDQAEGK